jgi:hypothetical protein
MTFLSDGDDKLRALQIEMSPKATHILDWFHLTPTVSLAVISLVASSCGYYKGHIEHHAAQSFTVHVAPQRGLAKRLQHRHPPHAQPVAPLRERHCRRPWLPPRRGTAQAPLSRSRDTPVAHTGGATPQSPHHFT